MKIDIGESDYNQIHRVGPKIIKDNVQVLHQVIAKCKGFSSRASVYRARKSNTYFYSLEPYQVKLLLKDPYNKVRDDENSDFECADINGSFHLCLKNGKWKFLNSSDELEQLL